MYGQCLSKARRREDGFTEFIGGLCMGVVGMEPTVYIGYRISAFFCMYSFAVSFFQGAQSLVLDSKRGKTGIVSDDSHSDWEYAD